MALGTGESAILQFVTVHRVENGKIKRYRVTCKITFEVEGRPKARGR